MVFNNFKDTQKCNSFTLETMHNFCLELTKLSLLTRKTLESDNLFKTENRLFDHTA